MTTATKDKEFAIQKLENAISTVERLLAGDWPNDESSAALHAIKCEFESKRDSLLHLDVSDDVILSWCKDSRQIVARYLSIVGIILRSSNIRNSFESYYPIQSVCRSLLGSDSKIIIGSEWDYTPFAYPIPILSLEKYIFVGLPASEAQNSLLLPIAGHELGHAVWRRTAAGSALIRRIQEIIIERTVETPQPDFFEIEKHTINPLTDLKTMQSWSRPSQIAVRQCEEVFCDLIGCWIFGESYLHAFRYLIYPAVGSRPSEKYPTNRARADYLADASSKFHGIKSELGEFFFNPPEASSTEVRLADSVTKAMFPSITVAVDEYCSERGLMKPSAAGTGRAFSQLRSIKPTLPSESMAEIVNAAWRLRFELAEWPIPGVRDERKIDILNELVFKSFEVGEFDYWGSAKDDSEH